MLVDDRRTHTDHIGVRQQPCFAILCLPYASSGCIFHFEQNFLFLWTKLFFSGVCKSQKKKGRQFFLYTYFRRKLGCTHRAIGLKMGGTTELLNDKQKKHKPQKLMSCDFM